ncbi:MAG TPA: hypothetical protein VMU13_01925 [Candidatus Paceibacterota bacterium]|nr:hypothetical protein [Candidatus Paceibacterota bacterium]
MNTLNSVSLRTLLGLLCAGLLLGAVAYAFYAVSIGVLSNPFSRSQDYSTITPTQFLLQNNTSFATGYQDLHSGDFSNGKQALSEALNQVTDSTQKYIVEFNLVYADEQLGDYSDAISLDKDIVANTSNWPIMQAYALQELGTIHYDNLQDNSITKEIFTGDPYSSFYSATSSPEKAYENLDAYAASIYPLGIVESRLAMAYVGELRDDLHYATSTLQGAAKVNQIKQAVRAANAYIDSVKDDPVASIDTSTVYAYNGAALADLAVAGAADPQQAEDAFKSAIQFTAARGLPPGESTNVMYAVFLQSMYGKSRIADIDQVLAPFSSSSPTSTKPAAQNFLISVRADPLEIFWHKPIIKLANIDPSFKDYLISIGWQASDFGT